MKTIKYKVLECIIKAVNENDEIKVLHTEKGDPQKVKKNTKFYVNSFKSSKEKFKSIWVEETVYNEEIKVPFEQLEKWSKENGYA